MLKISFLNVDLDLRRLLNILLEARAEPPGVHTHPHSVETNKLFYLRRSKFQKTKIQNNYLQLKLRLIKVNNKLIQTWKIKDNKFFCFFFFLLKNWQTCNQNEMKIVLTMKNF